MRVLDDSLYERQRQMEQTSVSEGVARYRKQALEATRRGDGAALKPAERLMLGWFLDLRKAIKAEIREVIAGRSGLGRQHYGTCILAVSPEKLAVIAMHTTIGRCLVDPLGTDQSRVVEVVGKAVNTEWNMPRIRKDEAAFDALVHTHRSKITPDNVRKVASKFLEDSNWGRLRHVHVGAILCKLLYEVATLEDGVDAFKTWIAWPRKNRSTRMIALTFEAMDFIDRGHQYRELLRPVFAPMIVPPLIWTTFDEGGYLSQPMRLVKKTPPRHRTRLRQASMPDVMAGVNALQSTAWKINRRVLDVVRELWASGGRIVGMPRRYPLGLPDKPADIDTNKKSKQAWKAEASDIHRTNAVEMSERVQFDKKLSCATAMAQEDAFWFPHTLDFCGRAYPTPVRLNHHGDDAARGLLEFAEDKPMDDRAEWWLKVHLANCCKIGGPFEQRVAWVDSSQNAISGWSADPLQNTGWMEQDKPLQALAASFALSDGGPNGVPVQMDGTCNALQHYAALGLNEADARMVNLIKTDNPQDPYTIIAERVAEQVAQDARDGNKIAMALDGLVTRSVVKQPCMTTLYGVTHIGARQQIEKSLPTIEGREKRFSTSRYLADLAVAGMLAICPTAAAMMEWLASCADLIANSGDVVRWTTPLGFLVEQPYRRQGHVTVSTLLQSIKIAGDIRDDAEPRRAKQRGAFAPNYIHSLDASHMLAAAQWCSDDGITLAAVHDSFWTHATDVDAMQDLLRMSFCAIHDRPLIGNLQQQFAATYPKLAFPAPPPMGSLDMDLVLTATYMCS